MKIKWLYVFSLAAIIGLFSTTSQLVAQQPNYLKLQPHKVQWAQQVMKDAVSKKDSLLLAEAYYLFGKIYEAAGDFITATDFYLKSLRIQEKRGDSYELVRLYDRLFNIESTIYKYPSAKRYLILLMNTAIRLESNKALAKAYGNLASFYKIDWALGNKNSKYPKPNYDSAFYFLKKAEVIVLKGRDEIEIAGIYNALGGEFLRRKDPLSISYFIKALRLSEKTQKPREIYSALIFLATAHVQFKQPDKAYSYLQQAIRISKTLPAHQNVFQRNNQLELIYSDYYKQKKNWKKALEHTEKLHEFEKSKLLADRDGALSRLNFDHEIEKKETQLKTQKRELTINAKNLKTQKLFTGVILVLLIISSGTGIAFYRLSQKNQRISQHNAQLVKEQNHRVKNNLQVVSSLLSLHSNRLTDDLARKAVSESQLRVETMAILHRRLYDGDKLIVVSMLDFIKEVIEGVLQTYGFFDVEIEFDIDDIELKPNHALSIGLIINELCTNACKYALDNTGESLISVNFKSNGNKINLIFADNGPGFNLEHAKSQKSFGLKLIQLQVDQLYGSCEFKTDKGTIFQMQFKTNK